MNFSQKHLDKFFALDRFSASLAAQWPREAAYLPLGGFLQNLLPLSSKRALISQPWALCEARKTG